MPQKPDETKQIDKFRQVARKLETDQSEEAFDHILKKVAKKDEATRVKKPKGDAK